MKISQKFAGLSLFSRLAGAAVFFSIMVVPLAQMEGGQSQAQKAARIKIDRDRTIGEIDPKIYGNFIEHLGRCIYGGIYDPASPLADEDGFRKDVIEATRRLNVTILRWPGGNFVSGYHWEDGIGPKESRPKRIDLAWGAIEPNLVGTDEYIRFCRKAGAEPYICINLGTGTWNEARYWVEYCNRESGTHYADLRRKNGADKPYQVTYWALGNEMDGSWQMGHRSAEDYGKFALEAAKMMKWVDPKIKLVACGSSHFGADWIGWNRTVLSYLKDYADYIALHTYLGDWTKDYYTFMARTTDVDARIKVTESLIRETMLKSRRKEPIYIAFDEWNVWYRAGVKEALEETYNLEDALVVALFLNTFVRNAHIVKIANMAQLVNVIAPIRADGNGMWLQTIYHPLYLFANHCAGKSLDVFVESETYDAGDYKSVPYLDVSAAYNAEKKELVLNVVNRHKDKEIEAEIISQEGQFSGKAVIEEVNGPDIKAENSLAEQKVKISTREMPVSGSRFRYRFPAHSFTMVKAKLN
ncbi:MAG: alpha-L-arabinofuranosidase C-terminal domain-containing protein [Clostridiales bacterium]|nr:alpha-L-arabinofuranosidase C-terminal domain-containing protein [Clostridiales bacterium]